MPPLPRRKAAPKAKARKPKKADKSPGLAAYAGSTVRPHEVGSRLTRYRQSQSAELVLRFCKYVAVAQSRNATGVASKALRVYRRDMKGNKSTRSGRTWAYETRALKKNELDRQRNRAGFLTRKAAEMSDEVEEIIDPMHPLVSLLTTPNPLMSGQQLLEQMQLGIGLTGDCYDHMVWGAKPFPVELWSLAPQFVRPEPSQTNIVEAYVYGRGTECERRIDAEEMIRFTQPNPRGDPYKGMGDLEKCIDAADLSVAFDQHRLATIDNGAQPGLILIDKKGGVEQRQQLEAALERKYSGVRNVGRSMVLTGEVEVQLWNMSEKEMSYLNSEELVLQTIANCHDVPVALLRLDTAALATAKAAIPQWELMALKPRCDRIADTLNLRLCPYFGDDIYVCFEEVVTKDMEITRTSVVNLYKGNILTLNESRAEIDYDALPDGDRLDREYAAEQAAALAILAPPIPPGGTEGDGGSKPPVAESGDAKADEDEREGAEQKGLAGSRSWSGPMHIRENGTFGAVGISIDADMTSLRDSLREAEAAVKEAVRIKTNGAVVSQKALILSGPELSCCPHAPRTMRKDANEEFMSMSERQLEGVIRSWFQGLPSKLIPELNKFGLTSQAEHIIALTLRTATEQPIRGIFTQGYNFGVQELPRPGNAQLMAALTGPAEQYLRKFEGKMVRSVSDTVNEQIKTGLADGVAAGESIPQLTERMRATTDGMSGVAAERIARTETSRAFQSSRIAAWKESGIVEGKRWMLAPSACELCEAIAAKFNEQNIPLDTAFFSKGDKFEYAGKSIVFDYASMDVANAHPNDRCTIAPVYKAF